MEKPSFLYDRRDLNELCLKKLLLHTASCVEIILNYESTSTKEVVFAFKLAEHNSVGDFLTYKMNHLTHNVIELLFVKVEIVENDFLCKVAD